MDDFNKVYLAKNRTLLIQKLFIIIFCIIIGTLFALLINLNLMYAVIIPAIILLLYLLKTPKVTYVLTILISIFLTFIYSPTISLGGLTIGLNPYKMLIIILVIGSLLKYLLNQSIAIKNVVNVRIFSRTIILWWFIVAFSTIITPLIDGGFVPYYLNSIKEMINWTLPLVVLIIGLYFLSWGEKDLKIYIDILMILTISIATYLLFKKDVFSNNFSLTGSQAYIVWSGVQKNQLPEIFTLITLLNISIGIQEKNFSKKIIRIAFSIVIIIAILSFFSRESFITLSVGIIVLFLFSKINFNKKIILIGITFISVCIIFLKTNFGEYIIQTIKTFSLSSPESAGYRVARWTDAMRIYGKYPLTGVGFSGYGYFSNFRGGLFAHNGFLQALVISGLPGFIIYCLVLFQTYKVLKNASLSMKLGSFTRACCRGLLAVLIGYIASNLVSDHFFSFEIFNILFWGTFAMVNGVALNSKE